MGGGRVWSWICSGEFLNTSEEEIVVDGWLRVAQQPQPQHRTQLKYETFNSSGNPKNSSGCQTGALFATEFKTTRARQRGQLDNNQHESRWHPFTRLLVVDITLGDGSGLATTLDADDIVGRLLLHLHVAMLQQTWNGEGKRSAMQLGFNSARHPLSRLKNSRARSCLGAASGQTSLNLIMPV
jgi:hypothetical protein